LETRTPISFSVADGQQEILSCPPHSISRGPQGPGRPGRSRKDRYAETAFKRLYWHGYEGRFGLFRWPAVPKVKTRARYDSEFNAWRSGAGLLRLGLPLAENFSVILAYFSFL